jgi:hypothetical protein
VLLGMLFVVSYTFAPFRDCTHRAEHHPRWWCLFNFDSMLIGLINQLTNNHSFDNTGYEGFLGGQAQANRKVIVRQEDRLFSSSSSTYNVPGTLLPARGQPAS